MLQRFVFCFSLRNMLAQAAIILSIVMGGVDIKVSPEKLPLGLML